LSEISFGGYALFLISLLILFTVQRLLHREIQAVLLIITKNPIFSIGLYSILLFPGVFIHELSHFLMALILRVPIKKFSLMPKTMSNGQLRLGFVETQQTNLFKDALIGLAPFIVGLVLVAQISLLKLNMTGVVNHLLMGNASLLFEALSKVSGGNDFGIWFYLAFAIGSTMIPSASDRQSWNQIIIVLILILTILAIAGLGPWVINNIAPKINQWMSSIAVIIVGADLIHLIILIPTVILRIVLSRLLNVELIY
jgi:hypothetical protein